MKDLATTGDPNGFMSFILSDDERNRKYTNLIKAEWNSSISFNTGDLQMLISESIDNAKIAVYNEDTIEYLIESKTITWNNKKCAEIDIWTHISYLADDIPESVKSYLLYTHDAIISSPIATDVSEFMWKCINVKLNKSKYKAEFIENRVVILLKEYNEN